MERLPIGIEGGGTDEENTGLTYLGIIFVVIVILLSTIFIYFFSPYLVETKNITTENKLPIADFTYTPEKPLTVTYIEFTDLSIDSDGRIVNWTWDFGDGNTSTLQNPTHRYHTPGTYLVTLIVTDNNGANDSKTKSIIVKSNYKEVYSDSIQGSDNVPANISTHTKEYSFDVYRPAKWINITLSYSITKNPSQPPLAKDSQLDIYLYYFEKNESVESDTTSNTEKTISLNAEDIAQYGYGKWSVLLHHYSENIPTENIATYTLTIEVIYEEEP